MKKLFMIGLGGSAPNANVEVHSMQFVYTESLEDCFPILKERWYGNSLHIDGYTELKYINGYKILPEKELDGNLYMIVYGGYKPNYIDELHDYHFIVASDTLEAKVQAKKDMKQFEYMGHVDEIVDVFQNVGIKLGLEVSNNSFKDNKYIHKFIKLR